MVPTTKTPRRSTSLRALLGLLLMVGLVLGAFSGVALADKVHKKFKGQVILSKGPFPTSFDGDGDAIKYINKVKEKEFIKDKRGKWTLEYWAFLKEELETKEAVIVFYDVTYGGEAPVEVYSEGVRPNDPHDNFIMGYVELDEEFFKPEMTYEMQVKRSRNTKPLATAEFKLIE